MKKEIIVSESWIIRVLVAVSSVGQNLAALYSYLLEESISVSQAWKIMHASVALVFLVFTSTSVEMRFAMLGWFLFTLWDCKKAGLK